MTRTITLDVLATAVQLTRSAESGPQCYQLMHTVNRIFIMKTQQSNLSRALVLFPNASLDFADDAMGFVHVWDFLLCFAGRTRKSQG